MPPRPPKTAPKKSAAKPAARGKVSPKIAGKIAGKIAKKSAGKTAGKTTGKLSAKTQPVAKPKPKTASKTTSKAPSKTTAPIKARPKAKAAALLAPLKTSPKAASKALKTTGQNPAKKAGPKPAPKPALRLAPASAPAPRPTEPPPSPHLPRPGESKTDWFARVAHDYYRFLYATALQITRNNNDAEDAVQNAVLNGIKRLDQLTEPGAIVSWLAMISRNAALDVLRRKKRLPSGGGDATVLPIAAPETQNEYTLADDMRSVLSNAIATLPLSYQEVVNARHFDGLEVEDIAKRLNATENSIRVRLFRAYEKLRESAQVRRALGLPAESPKNEN